jgi:hypothetical protein
MASDEQETLIDAFEQVAGQQDSSTSSIFDSESSIATTLNQLIEQTSQLSAGGNQSPSLSGSETTGEQFADLASQLSVGGSQSSNLSAKEISGGQVSEFSSNEPNVINVSGEAGSRLNSAPTTEPIEPSWSSGASGSGSSGAGSSILSLVSSIFGGGLGAIPLVSGLLDLFGGGSSEPPPLEKYVKPDQLNFTGADTPDGVEDADYDQYGMPRLYTDATSGSTSQTGSLNGAPAPSAGGGGAGSPINVTIQALDSQSFLDRSSDIAQAVRQAMLNSGAINDVVNDLQ